MSQGWRLVLSETLDDPAMGYGLDQAIAEHVGAGQSSPTLRFWRPGPSLALGRFDAKLPRYQEAVGALKQDGVTVLKRLSGGKAVWQDKGYLNFSVLAPRERIGIPEAYRKYSEGLQKGLGKLGVHSDFRHVQRAFCDGPYDLAVGPRKLVGTAQVQKKAYLIVHGTMLVDCSIPHLVEVISRFYELAGAPTELEPETMITLREAMARIPDFDRLVGALAEGYAALFGPLDPQTPSLEELQRAQELRREVLV